MYLKVKANSINMGFIKRVIGKVGEGIQAASRTIGKHFGHVGGQMIGKIQHAYDFAKKHAPHAVDTAEKLAETLHPNYVKSAREAWHAARGIVKSAEAYGAG